MGMAAIGGCKFGVDVKEVGAMTMRVEKILPEEL